MKLLDVIMGTGSQRLCSLVVKTENVLRLGVILNKVLQSVLESKSAREWALFLGFCLRDI